MHPTDPQELIIRVGRRIAELRSATGMTQADFAEAMGYVGLLERGKQNLTLEKMAEVGNVLGASVEDLLRKPKRGSLEIKKGRPSRQR